MKSNNDALNCADCDLLMRMIGHVMQTHYGARVKLPEELMPELRKVDAKLAWLKRECELREREKC